jgi:hypothetical protein
MDRSKFIKFIGLLQPFKAPCSVLGADRAKQVIYWGKQAMLDRDKISE